MLQDLRFAFRLILKERWYAAVAVIALALGIGVNATGFAIVNGAFLRGPAFKETSRLFMLSWLTGSEGRNAISVPDLLDWRSQSKTFDGIGAYTERTMNISDDRAMPEQIDGALVTANAFAVLGQPLLLGRDFLPAEDQRGADRVAILGYRVWKNRYASNSDVLGARIRINGEPATIIGVMPDKMNFPINAELWTPFIPAPADQQRGALSLNGFGRLRDGATLREARMEMNGIAQQFATAYPDSHKNFRGVRIESIPERFVGGAARVVFIAIMGAAGFVLLIACANVANLMLSRSSSRTKEIAVRVALGASRGRVVRQLLLESVLLAGIGGVLGVGLAIAGVNLLDAALTDPGKPYWITFTLDYTVLVYTAGICVLTGILFGILPALQVSATNMNDLMNQAGRSNSSGWRARRFSSAMVVLELALTMVLLVGAGLMVRSFFKLYTLDIGVRTDGLMAMQLRLPELKYATPEARLAFFEQLMPRLTSLPGIESAAVTTAVPPNGAESRPVEIEGQAPSAPGQQGPRVQVVRITPAFFETAGSPVRRGRGFAVNDGASGYENVIVNERMAGLLFSGQDPLGKRIRLNPREPWLTIVGICPTISHGGIRDGVPNPAAYIPLRQDAPAAASLLFRSSLPPSSVMDSVRREVRSIDQDQPVFTIETIDQILAQTRWPYRTFGSVFAIFAVIALVLSSVGLYAVMAYAVTQRTQEIGVRIAVGAEGSQILWLILRRGLGQLAAGLALGLVGAFALSSTLQRALAQVSPTDPITFIGITALLTSVALAACIIPAHRATRVDPLIALRGE